MKTRIYLWFCAVAFLPYGLYCFAQPGALEEIAGVAFTSPTGSVELRAMYGGLQTAVGVLALLGALRAGLARTAVTAIAALCGGLALARLSGAVVEGSFASYTVLGLGFEITLFATGLAVLGTTGNGERAGA